MSIDINNDANEDNSKDMNEGMNKDFSKVINDDVNNNNKEKVNESFNEDINLDELMLSTIDNPHSPKEDYDMWKRWDKENGYNTEEYIARLVNMESEYDVDDEFTLNILTSKVIEDILANDEIGIYRLI